MEIFGYEIAIEVLVQSILALATITLVIVTAIHMKRTSANTNKQLGFTEKQLELTRREMNSRLSPILNLESFGGGEHEKDGKWTYKITFFVHNTGKLPAYSVKVSHFQSYSEISLRDLIQSEKEIKSSHFPIKGSITSERSNQVLVIVPEEDRTKPFYVAFWLVYNFADEIDVERIFVYQFSGGYKATYEDAQIKKDRQEWNDFKSGQGGTGL